MCKEGGSANDRGPEGVKNKTEGRAACRDGEGCPKCHSQRLILLSELW